MKKYYQVKRISELQSGDIVRAKNGSISYMITGNYGDRATAVRTQDITNPGEWEVLRHEPEEHNEPEVLRQGIYPTIGDS